MIYARVASGYRPGGTNAICGTFAQATPEEPDLPDITVPCQFKPDKTVNYELGAKGDLAGGVLSYDVSLFNIDWNDIQIVQVLGSFAVNSNVGKARSRGFEIALEARPTERLTLSAWWAYVDATLREDAVSNANFYAVKGDRLPYSSKHTGRFSFDYEAPVSGRVTASFGASATYVGNRKGEFVPTAAEAPLRANYPGYVQFDLTAGLEFDNWNVNLFVQNLTNKHGVIGGGFWNQTSFNENWFNYAQPRTVGVNAEFTF
jgi:outer membrane receptor protein involved in Fe transport